MDHFGPEGMENSFVTAPNTPMADCSSGRTSHELSDMQSLVFSGSEGEGGVEPMVIESCLNDTADLEGTPLARPVKWMVDKVNTEIRKLREKTEEIQGQCFPTGREDTLRVSLMEAFKIIQEQDGLIHCALLGKLAGVYGSAENHENTIDSVDEFNLYSPLPKYPPTNMTYTDGSHLSNNWMDDFEKDFLPPASPETFELLKSLKWPILPTQNQMNNSPINLNIKDLNLNDTNNDNNSDDNDNILTQLLQFSPVQKEIKKDFKIENIKTPLSPKNLKNTSNIPIPTPLKSACKEITKKEVGKSSKKLSFLNLFSDKKTMVINENDIEVLNDVQEVATLEPKQLYMDEI